MTWMLTQMVMYGVYLMLPSISLFTAFCKYPTSDYLYRKFILTMLSVCSPIPAGVLTPSFILGAVLGRLYGYVLKAIGVSLGINLIRCKSVCS